MSPDLSRDDILIGPIEHGVPVPEKRGGGGNHNRALGRIGLAFDSMAPGDSRLFSLPADSKAPASRLSQLLTGAAVRYWGAGKFTVRILDNGVRLWRTR